MTVASGQDHSPGRGTLETVELLADILRRLAGQQTRPHLARLAGRLGVRSVTTRPNLLGLDGRTTFGAAGPVVEISATRPRCYQRVALAHELAHILLMRHELYLDVVGQRLDLGGVQEEHLCDAVAEALLVPARSAVGTCEGLGQLMAEAALLDVPVMATIRRARALSGRPLPLLLLERRSSRWSVTLAEGWPSATTPTPCDQTVALLDSLCATWWQGVRSLPFTLGQGGQRIALEAAMGAGRTLLGLARSDDHGGGARACRGDHLACGFSGHGSAVRGNSRPERVADARMQFAGTGTTDESRRL